MPRRILPIRAGLVAALCLTACRTGSHGRVCEPINPDSCGSGRICVIDRDGVPDCLSAPDGGVTPEGNACTAQDECGAGIGCIRVNGVARCTRFCALIGESGEEGCAEFGECIAALPDRPDIALCVYRCALDTTETDDPRRLCPEGSVCSPEGRRDLGDFPICGPIPTGSAPADDLDVSPPEDE